jgi:nucleoside-diphosphate kinase
MTNNEYQNFLVILKPDAIDRRLFGKIVTRFEEAGFDIIDMKYGAFPKEHWANHYAEHSKKPHFNALCERMADRDVAVFYLSGQRGIERARRMIGCTDALEAAPGTIRGDYGNRTAVVADNLVHVSDSPASADHEIGLWFGVNDGE